MPTILTCQGTTFKILTRDHDPAHVHVYRAGDAAKIGLGDEENGPYLMLNVGMKAKDLRQALEIVEQNQAMLLAAWRKYHG
jgi:hypothetical protein